MSGEAGKAQKYDGGDRSLRLGPVVVWSLVPLVALLLCRAIELPLGQPFFLIYRYSPVPLLRLEAVALAVPAVVVGIWMLARATCGSFFLATVFFFGLVVWTFFAPPNYAVQRLFDLQSPSHEGAFVIEARTVPNVREYVGTTFYERIQKSPEQMRGRRVISNPAGMTVAFSVVRGFVAAEPGLRDRLISWFDLRDVQDPSQRVAFASAMLVAFGMTVIWGFSIVPAYALCRLWMSPLGACAIALACVFNPASVNFSPGKDSAQMFPVLVILFCWSTSHVQRRRAWAAVGGVMFVCSMMVGIIHVWVLAIVVGATLWDAAARGAVACWMKRTCAPFALGAGLGLASAQVLLDWNVVRMAMAVAARYREIQVPIVTDPFYWTLVGLPLFLLFIGPAIFGMVVGMRRDVDDQASRFAGRLLVCTLVVLAITYFLGNNNETPRLWIPFIPLLLVSLAMGRGGFRFDSPRNRVILLMLVALQVGVTLLNWSLMDVRETEYRLSTGRMWN